jgi:hypothetical protein
VATTGTVSVSGVYYISANPLVFVDTTDAVYCYVAPGAEGNFTDGFYGGYYNPGSVGLYASAAVTDVWFVDAGDVVNLYCESNFSDPNSLVYGAQITATLISNENGVTFNAARDSNPNRDKVQTPPPKIPGPRSRR